MSTDRIVAVFILLHQTTGNLNVLRGTDKADWGSVMRSPAGSGADPQPKSDFGAFIEAFKAIQSKLIKDCTSHRVLHSL